MRIRTRPIAAWLVAFACLGGLAGCHPKAPEQPVVRPVLSTIVHRQTPQVAESLTGTVQPRYQVELGFQTSGRMLSRNANIGDLVAKGEQLATLDSTVQRENVVTAQAELFSADAALTDAQANYERKRALVPTAAAAQAALDAATAARDSARATVDQAKASLKKANEELGYTNLVSGYDGVVVNWPAEIGEVVSVGQPIVVIARPNPRDAVFDVPDDKLDAFRPGAVFQVSLLAAEEITDKATVREIAPQSDPATRTRRIRLTLENPSQAYRLGTTIRLMVMQSQPEQIEIPADAVLDEGGVTSVWLVGPGSRVIKRRVTLGARDDGHVVVTSGLADGERLIVVGIHSLADGQQVKVPDGEGTSS